MEGGNIILMKNYLFDKSFLYELDQYHHKELYVKIIALTIDENPIEQIEGRVTGGSINVDGTSSVRRTCSISLVANDVNINDFYWGLNTKFRFEIGVKNDINSNYPEIIWFPQGTYIITSFNTSLGTNNYTINISGKDKMCLLNGEVSGSLPSSIDFGSIDNYKYFYGETAVTQDNYQADKYYTLQHFELANELNGDYYLAPNSDTYKSKEGQTLSAGTPTYNLVNNSGVDDYKLYNDKYCEDLKFYAKDYTVTNEDLTIKNIVCEAVHVYGSEPYHNIVINDLDEKGLELMEYRGDKNLYVFYNLQTGEFENITMDEKYICYTVEDDIPITVDMASEGNPLVENFNADAINVYVKDRQGNEFGPYIVAKIATGDTAGYRITDLTYAGDLIANPGESLTSVLDKIVNMLGDFEYYYDLEGRFIFQKKRTYINTNWSTIKGDGYDRYVEDAAYSSPVTYSFEDNNLVTSFQNSPDLLNLRNDYSVWGKRKGVTGKEIPIHARYAIDKKPYYYKSILGEIYTTKTMEELAELCGEEPETAHLVDWREIIYQMAIDYYQYNNDIDDTSIVDGKKIELPYQGYTQDDFLSVIQENNIILEENQKVFLYPGGNTGYERYYIDLQGFWRDIYDPGVEPEYVYDGGYYESYNEYKDNTNIYVVKKRYVDPYPVGLSNNHLLPEDQKEEIVAVVKAGINKAYARELMNLNDTIMHTPDTSSDPSWLARAKTIRNNWNVSTSQYGLGDISASDYNTLLGDAETYTGYIGQSRQLAEDMFSAMGLSDNSSSTNKNLTNAKLQKEIIDKKYREILENLDKALNPYFSEHYPYWNKDVLEYPEKLNFWLEFLDEAGELDQFSIPTIGDRPKVVNDNDVRAIYFREIPNLIYQISSKNTYNSYDFKTGYTYINLPKNCENLFTISALGKSAKEAIDVLLYNYSYCVETITLNTIPVYYLEPNVRIYVFDENSKINGEYIVNRITVPLAYNGTMSIQANKVTERIY